jgi:hypothetical protein
VRKQPPEVRCWTLTGRTSRYIEDETERDRALTTHGQERDVLLGGGDPLGGILEICSFLVSMARSSNRLLGVSNHRTKGRASVKYMLLIMGFRKGEGMPQPPSSGAPSVEEFMQYQQELGQAGVHVDSALLHSFEDATQVQVNDAGERLVTNGPFAESREYLGGYQIIDVPDLDAALDWAARCPGAKYGRVEVRPLAEF